MKVLCIGTDLGGNVPPMLAVARELARRGVDVELVGIRGTASDEGSLAAVPFPRPRGRSSESDRKGPGLVPLVTSRRVVTATTALIADRRPDAVVVDCMTLAPIKGANDSGVPTAVLFHTFGAYWMDAFVRGPAARVLRVIAWRPSVLWGASTERLLVTDRELDPAREDTAPLDFSWTGSTEVGRDRVPREPGTPPRILVALSTTPVPGMRGVYRRVVDALRELPVEAVVTTGGVRMRGLAGAPNVEVRGFVPHHEILPSVDLLVGHGGHSTTMKALAYGIPVLVLPVNPTADQRLIGEMIEAEGLGRWLPSRSSAARIREVVQALLDDAPVRDRAAATGQRLRALPPGAEVAAARIMAIATAQPRTCQFPGEFSRFQQE